LKTDADVVLWAPVQQV
jgi:hypothetical protein